MIENKNITQIIIFSNHANIRLFQNNVGNFCIKGMEEFQSQELTYQI